MKGIITAPRKLWGFVVWLVEKADIIPPLVFVSAWHYAGALAKLDPPAVAVILGVLIDLGHYRSVKAVMARPEERRRLVVMTTLTVMTGYYHWLWYRDIILAVTVPVLIICLSLLGKWGGWERQALRVNAVQYASNAVQMQEQKIVMLRKCKICGEEVSNIGNHTRWKHGKGGD